jgi:flagellar export protein FliJ
MADLASLIRLRRHTVEEKQKVLADIYRQVEKIEEEKISLFDRLQKEREAMEADLTLETREYYGRFKSVVENAIEKLNIQLKELETRLNLAQEEVRAAFADMKRVEIVHKRRLAEEQAEIDSKETSEMDAIGIEGFRRKEEI